MNTFDHEKITQDAKALFREERALMRLDGWFLIRESHKNHAAEAEGMPKSTRAAYLLRKAIEELPISVSRHACFAGTQRDAFARSYALINPSFRVETFSGYCDPTAVYGDIEPNAEFPEERIRTVREFDAQTPYVRALSEVYKNAEPYTAEVIFFIEQVTGHIIPDFRFFLANGVDAGIEKIDAQLCRPDLNDTQRDTYTAMRMALENVLLLASRYETLARMQAEETQDEEDRMRLLRIADALCRVPRRGAHGLFEAIQSFLMLWEVMCLEQAPNPFAFSVGNADRIFEPYRAESGLSREETAALLRHFLVFFNVADRSWAISQNILLGGKDTEGHDLTNLTSYAFLDAYFDMNLPQPILSVKLHKTTPDVFYRELGRFFFTPGCLTPSLFNDDALFPTLRLSGVLEEDLPDYAVAGCQEPLIMGKENGNTTSSWLNLGKVLELTLSGGVSTVTGEVLDPELPKADALTTLKTVRERFYGNLEKYVHEMAKAASGAAAALSYLPVPFLSSCMGGLESGYDMRDVAHQGTPYQANGCLIHGLNVTADSFLAIDYLLRDRPEDAQMLLDALRADFRGYDDLREYLLHCPKFGNHNRAADAEAANLANRVSDLVRAEKNALGNPFKPDFSTPSTHLLYGYWVGALPDGRHAREMLNYGVDPLAGDAHEGMGFRILSLSGLPFEKMCGGYASHMGIDPRYFRAESMEDKGLEFKQKIVNPLFFSGNGEKIAPFYLYVNVTTAELLRKVLAKPKKYAPSGVYIMRIHGTFVNFLDLSPAIQEDIIRRLDPASTVVC